MSEQALEHRGVPLDTEANAEQLYNKLKAVFTLQEMNAALDAIRSFEKTQV